MTSVEAGAWPERPFVYEAKAGHQGRAEGQVATGLMWGQPYILRRRLSPCLFPTGVGDLGWGDAASCGCDGGCCVAC